MKDTRYPNGTLFKLLKIFFTKYGSPSTVKDRRLWWVKINYESRIK